MESGKTGTMKEDVVRTCDYVKPEKLEADVTEEAMCYDATVPSMNTKDHTDVDALVGDFKFSCRAYHGTMSLDSGDIVSRH